MEEGNLRTHVTPSVKVLAISDAASAVWAEERWPLLNITDSGYPQ